MASAKVRHLGHRPLHLGNISSIFDRHQELDVREESVVPALETSLRWSVEQMMDVALLWRYRRLAESVNRQMRLKENHSVFAVLASEMCL